MAMNQKHSEPIEFDLTDLLSVFKRSFAPVTLTAVIVGVTVYFATALLPKTYVATAKFLPPQTASTGGAAALLQSLSPLTGALSSSAGKSTNDQYIAFLKSRNISSEIVEKFNLKKYYGVKTVDEALKKLGEDSVMTTGKDGLIVVEFASDSPDFSAKLANAYVTGLERLVNSLALTEAQQRRVFFESQLIKARKALQEADAQLMGVGVNVSSTKISAGSTLGLLANLSAQLSAREAQLAAMQKYVTPESQEFKKISADISALRQQIKKIEEGGSIQEKEGIEYLTQLRNQKQAEAVHEFFARQLEAARMDEAKDSPKIQVIDWAVAPEVPSGPKRKILTVFAVLGGALVVFLISLLNYLKTMRINDNQVVEAAKSSG